MGIQGLLPFLQKCSRKVDMSEFAGCTVAIDVYCWLHKGAFSCAEKLARGEDTDQYVQYCMKFVNMLLSHNIKPILVFDGCHLPAKAETEKSRRERREHTKKKACELLRSEKIDEARQMLRRCVDVTHSMAHKLITRARAANVDCIVAPFEADAQLAYLNISGIAHFVVTEDSDLLLFGCTKVVFKLDIGGTGLLIEQEMLPVAMKMRPDEFSLDKFRQMCVLSGCDYLSSLPGIGLTKACKFVKLTSQSDVSKILHKIGSYLNMPNLHVPDDYKYNFINAMNMFKHQPIFDPRKRCVLPLTPVEEGMQVVLPKAHPPEIALQLALGNIDPISMKTVDEWNPDTHLKETQKSKSIWSSEYQIRSAQPPSRISKMVPSVKSTFGKRVSVQSEDFMQLSSKKSERSEEKELKEMKESWSVCKKRRLETLVSSDNEVSLDDLIEPSPPKLNPFRTTTPNNSGNAQLTGSTTLSRLTSPPAVNKISSPSPSSSCLKSSFSKFNSPPSTTSKVPTVISRYFASSSDNKINSEINQSSCDLKQCTVQVTVVPESPCKVDDNLPESVTPKLTRSNVFKITSPIIEKSNICETNSESESIKLEPPKKSILSLMEDEDENYYKSVKSSENINFKSGLSSFKWKPLVANDKLAVTKKEDRSTLKNDDSIPYDTPPNSQEAAEKVQASKLTSHLEPPRSVGLSNKNRTPQMQTFLSKFKFQPKLKSKLKS